MKIISSLFRIILSLMIVVIAVTAVILREKPDVVRAVGDLTVTFPSTPFFNEPAFAPGDSLTKTMTVQNTGTIARLVAVRASNVVRSTGSPDIDEVLTVKIREGVTTLIPTQVLKNFLDDAGGVNLNIINPGQTKLYSFDIDFPSSAGNAYQGRSVSFDLSGGAIIGDSVVINEIFFWPDAAHGLDCPVPPGSQGGNKALININVNQSATTGGNKTNNNTTVGSVGTGSASNKSIISLNLNQIGGSAATCDEWIELFNPTNADINLKNWKFVDGSGVARTINANVKIKAGRFALVAKSKRTFSRFWSVPNGVTFIELGNHIGDGLGNLGDRLRLVNPSASTVDTISWGSDINPPHYSGVIVQGHSIERLVPGFDIDSGTDFTDRAAPTPGS